MATQQPSDRSVEIRRHVKAPAIDPARLGKEDLLVEYVVGGRATYTVRIPDPDATAQAIEEAVKKDAKRFVDTLGKRFTL